MSLQDNYRTEIFMTVTIRGYHLDRIAVFVAWIIVVFIFIPFSMQSQNLMFPMTTVSFLTVIFHANIAKDDRIALFSISHNLPLRKTQ